MQSFLFDKFAEAGKTQEKNRRETYRTSVKIIQMNAIYDFIAEENPPQFPL